MKEEFLNHYWKYAFTHRVAFKDEVVRLSNALYGFFYKETQYDRLTNRLVCESPLDFWDSKRPYGNKDVPASIVFNLGWDYLGISKDHPLPDFVVEETERLHAAVYKELLIQEEFLARIASEKT